MDVQAERVWLLERIKQNAEPEYRVGATMATGTGLTVYGVRVPRMREIAREWQRAHRGVSWEDVVALAEVLWDGESQEERSVAVELLERFARHIPELSWDHLDRWRRKVDNWALTDGLGVRILGRWLQGQPEGRLARLADLIADADVWSRRLALVATIPLNRGDPATAIPDLTLELINRVKTERHPMITKAISWALREMSKSHADRVSTYLEQNREVLAAHVVREVDNKLRTGLKRGG